MMNEPSEQTAKRAAELWRRMLENPKYDALGSTGTPEDVRNMGMASVMASVLPNNATAELLDALAEELAKQLMNPDRSTYERISLGVDYGPDLLLAEVAKTVGLEMQWPWKTRMYIDGDRCVSVSAGYGAEDVYHYPLPGNRWLVTTLSGSDIVKVIEYVDGGHPEFVIE